MNNASLSFLRFFFVLLSIFFITVYTSALPNNNTIPKILFGITIGAVFSFCLILFDLFFLRKSHLRLLNITALGIFFGYLISQGLLLTFQSIFDMSSLKLHLEPHSLDVFKIGLILVSIYMGIIMTFKASDEISFSIPFIRFTPETERKKDLIVDISVLADPRIIDLASTGLLDHQLILPKFVIKELYAQGESNDDTLKARSKKCLEVVKKLEGLSHLQLRYNDADFPDIKEMMGKIVRVARLLDANILSADISRVQMHSIEGITVINLHILSNALKPLVSGGELIKIKIQRYGKEPRQGVGYLEDGTMVVVNGGGDFIGDTINAYVLSLKHTSSGKMIFCNVADEYGNPLTLIEET